jgi:hypothetical protein
MPGEFFGTVAVVTGGSHCGDCQNHHPDGKSMSCGSVQRAAATQIR